MGSDTAMIASPMATSTGKSGFVPGNQVTLLQDGEAFFSAIEQAFDRARYEIYLATYIYEDDATGRRISDALKRAVLRGVRVYLVIDGYGSSALPRHMRDQMLKDGIRLRVFRPGISPWTLRRKRLRRMHRKIVVVDREIAFVGGINIVDDKASTSDMAPRYDYAVAVEGAAGGRGSRFCRAVVVCSGTEGFSQSGGPDRRSAGFDLLRGINERRIPVKRQFPPSAGHRSGLSVGDRSGANGNHPGPGLLFSWA